MNINKTLKLAATSAALVSGLVLSAGALASGGDSGGGDCRVSEVRTSGTIYFVPSGNGPFPILGWGNGTTNTVSQYDGLLEAAAEECVIVAAATTSSSGSGRQIADSVNAARSRYRSIANDTICTSGHSQGGGGSINAGARLGSAADCVIALQPDTVFTSSVSSNSLSRSTNLVCIFGSSDSIAPAYSNGPNCRRAATGTYVQETVSGGHTLPYSGTGGALGREMRDYINRWMK
ncbi:hypothetical protein [Aurantivibrio plasticivorans]